MLTRRTTIKGVLGSLAALALPKGATAAALPASIDQPTTELLPGGVMPFNVKLFGFGWHEDMAGEFSVETRITIAEDGAWRVAFMRKGEVVGGYAGTGQEPAGAILSVILGGLFAVRPIAA